MVKLHQVNVERVSGQRDESTFLITKVPSRNIKPFSVLPAPLAGALEGGRTLCFLENL